MNDAAITLEIEQLAQYVFVQNRANKKIGLDIHGLGHSKDLFCFCLDLFCKGIVLIGGVNDDAAQERRAEIDSISMDQFNVISRKMLLAGIKCSLDMQPLEAPMTVQESRAILFKSISNIHNMPESLPIKDYEFTIKMHESLCTVRFEIVAV